jgi:hypothetical protein
MSQPPSTFESSRTARLRTPAFAEKDILAPEKRVRDQEADVLRLIAQGAPTQSAEDLCAGSWPRPRP